jgi:holo-[acyl-carrier protein] synthase
MLMIKGIGTDILDIRRFERLHLTWGNKLVEKLFNNDEVPSFSSNKKFIQSLAGKFAAKEAISKAFGTGIGSHISFKDIKILKDKKGKPVASIKKLNLEDSIHISISHSNDYAVAFAVVEET